jgi:hypothetical protein
MIEKRKMTKSEVEEAMKNNEKCWFVNNNLWCYDVPDKKNIDYYSCLAAIPYDLR